MVVDLARAIISRAGLSASVDAMEWGQAQEKLKSGSADALLQINSNPEREKIFSFSEPLLLSEFTIFRRSDRVDIRSMSSLKGLSVGVEAKGYPVSLLKKYPEVSTRILASWSDGFKKLSDAQLDAIVVDRWVGEFELSKLGITNVVVVEEPIESGYSSIAVRKNDTELLARINAALREIRSDGSYDEIIEKRQKYEVVYFTREEQFRYILMALVAFMSMALLRSLLYVRRVRSERATQLALSNRLQVANDELTQFSYRASHDLKSPLISIIGLSDYILEDVKESKFDDVADNLVMLREQALKLENTVVDVLNLHKAGSEGISEIESFQLAGLLQTIEAKLHWLFKDSGCELQTAGNLQLWITGPRVRYQQIIENLVTNSVKYRDRSKPLCFVRVEVANEADELSILVEDNGLGIPKQYHQDVMKMFKRFHPHVSSGTGLGLAIVQKHVEALDGSIDFSSSTGGTAFRVSLPGV